MKIGSVIKLPNPNLDGNVSLEKAMTLRRSIRSYKDIPMNISEVSQLLWSAQGITNERGFRTAPSAGATFPLETYIVVNNVTELKKGIYYYQAAQNELEMISDTDISIDLMKACLSQSMIVDGAVVIVFAAIFERTTARYGERGIRYVYNEIGHASQNVHLQAAALDLGTVVIGAYRDDEVEAILNLGDDKKVLYLMPVGKLN
ncbi:MAG: SagB/ThcOx family dehydrogenase [Bacteroidetes bacterium]|nr:SagB/ThcOx family dehydrogenase [Bacteroidota bacterium]